MKNIVITLTLRFSRFFVISIFVTFPWLYAQDFIDVKEHYTKYEHMIPIALPLIKIDPFVLIKNNPRDAQLFERP